MLRQANLEALVLFGRTSCLKSFVGGTRLGFKDCIGVTQEMVTQWTFGKQRAGWHGVVLSHAQQAKVQNKHREYWTNETDKDKETFHFRSVDVLEQDCQGELHEKLLSNELQKGLWWP